jgi:hypothetical protein
VGDERGVGNGVEVWDFRVLRLIIEVSELSDIGVGGDNSPLSDSRILSGPEKVIMVLKSNRYLPRLC